jgi:hypothetical protein
MYRHQKIVVVVPAGNAVRRPRATDVDIVDYRIVDEIILADDATTKNPPETTGSASTGCAATVTAG